VFIYNEYYSCMNGENNATKIHLADCNGNNLQLD
jgi:hypothetical protein